MNILTVATVLKTGGEFKPEHVKLLHGQVSVHLTIPHRFVCLTDAKVECEALPLKHGWPGWWSKIELFDGRLSGPVLYMDLDTAIVGNIDDIATGHRRITVLDNFWGRGIGSGLMAWDENVTGIYERFKDNADEIRATFKTRDRWGDQAFIYETIPATFFEFWQIRHPGRVVSYRRHVEPIRKVPAGASIICFGGNRRPWNTHLWR